tara:strand:+ start:1511 stop:2683 length:1173 start_codon:yes stop_codon:yes gene_type:complete
MRDDWEIKCLGEIGDIFSGNSINAKTKEEKYLNVTTGLNYIATKDIAYNTSINYDNGVKIPYDQTCNFRVAKKGSVLICSEGGSAGRKIGLLNQDVCFVNKLYAISTNEYVIPSYIFYYYQSIGFKLQFKERLTGLIGGVSKNKFKQIEIPIPSTKEQKEIVEILDQAFESIEKAKANIEKNIENAKELFQSKVNQVFSQTGEGWSIKQLNEICENLDRKRIPTTKNKRKPGEVPYYGASGIVDYVEGYLFDEDLLLVSEDGANLLARTYPIAFSISGKTWVNNHAHVLRFEDISTQFFIEYYLNSIKLDDYVSGMAQPKLNQKKLSSIPVPYPELSIQKELVETLDVMDNHIQSLLSSYEEELKNLEELKKSILQKAFSGELTNKNKAA